MPFNRSFALNDTLYHIITSTGGEAPGPHCSAAVRDEGGGQRARIRRGVLRCAIQDFCMQGELNNINESRTVSSFTFSVLSLFPGASVQVRVKQEMVNDESRVKCTVASLGGLDLAAECKQMIDAINKYN